MTALSIVGGVGGGRGLGDREIFDFDSYGKYYSRIEFVIKA